MRRFIASVSLLTIFLAADFALAQQQQQQQQPQPEQQPQSALVPDTGVPVFRVDSVSRSIKVVNFHHRQGSTEMELKASSLSPRASGLVRVESRQGATKIDARVEKLNPSQAQGEEYLTYVLWAVTPEGRPENLGELAIDGSGDARLQAATELQSFGLLVTAEPFFAVTQPSDVIVMEAVVSKGTLGTISPLEAKYELWPRGMYAKRLPQASRIWSAKTGKEAPPSLIQAKHAVNIAKSVNASEYAADSLRKAEVDLGNAESYFNNKGDLKKIQTLARNATQLAEDARLISMKRAEEARLEAERKAAADRVAAAQTAAEQETRKRELAESERKLAQEREETARLRADQEQRERRLLEIDKAALAEARASSETARLAALEESASLKKQKLAIEAEAERAKLLAADAEQKRLAAEAASRQAILEQQKLQAEQQRLQTEAAKARADADRSIEALRKAESERLALREQLREQLNSVLATRENARGLIVNLADVLFETGQYALRPAAREKLAKISGIVIGHPDLRLEVEGHTDSVGGAAFNQTLSERRADSVRQYLVEQGVKAGSISSRGFGMDRPAAENTTAAGRQQNRRVELVVSGDSIRSSSSSSAVSAGPISTP